MTQINGTPFNDNGIDKPVLIGTSAPDQIYAGTGHDKAFGGRGGDYIDGWEGNDTLYGGKGTSFDEKNTGDDVLVAWSGNDTLYGQDGDDWLDGSYDDDSLYGGPGDDILGNSVVPEPGNDIMYGGRGNDKLYGGPGNDFLNGYGEYSTGETDTLTGGSEADVFGLGYNGSYTSIGYLGAGHANITDFNWQEGDKIRLGGSKSSYSLTETSEFSTVGALDTAIKYSGDVIGVVKNVTGLNIDAGYFSSL